MNTAIKGDRIYEDADYFVLKKKTLFSSPFWFRQFGKVFVQCKRSGTVMQVTPAEKAFWLAVVGEMALLGIGPSDQRFKAMMQRFSEGVLSRGEVRWGFFFQNGSPRELALQFQ